MIQVNEEEQQAAASTRYEAMSGNATQLDKRSFRLSKSAEMSRFAIRTDPPRDFLGKALASIFNAVPVGARGRGLNVNHLKLPLFVCSS